MLKLEDYKIIFAAVGMIGALLFASPALALVLQLPPGERFSELWILGPGHMAEDYPFNIKPNEAYKIFLGIGNHMGCSEYYLVYVKLRNQSEPLPNSLNGTPSVLNAIFEFRSFLADGQTWETGIVFSFGDIAFNSNLSRVSTVAINGYELSVDKAATWDGENRGFYLQLFFELWLYNSTTSSFQYHNRFVGLWLNMTRAL